MQEKKRNSCKKKRNEFRWVESQNIVCKRLFFHVLDMKLETAFSKPEKRLELNDYAINVFKLPIFDTLLI